MASDQRHERLKRAVHRLNQLRKQQAKQIDILCNDFIGAQRSFIQRLAAFEETLSFYQVLLGLRQPESVLQCAGRFFSEVLPETRIVFYLPPGDRHGVEKGGPENHHAYDLFDSCFTPNVIDSISAAQRPCSLEDMLALGLQVHPNHLGTLCARTLPLVHANTPLGFVLLSRTASSDFDEDRLTRLLLLSRVLSQALAPCLAPN